MAAKARRLGAVEDETVDASGVRAKSAKQFKVIVLGDGAVGKTSLCERFVNGRFELKYKQTVGLDFFLKRVENLPGGEDVTLQLWDIGGQSIGSRMIKKYIKGAHAIILAYDLTQYQSFADLDDWFRLVVEAFEVPGAAAASNAAALATASGESKVGEEATEAAASTLGDGITQHSVGGRIVAARLPHVVLVANKMDLAHTRAVKVGKHKAFVQENSLAADYFVSAKSGDYVPQTFTRIAAALAGVKLDRADVLQATKVVTAQIVNHQANDPAVDEKGSSGGDKSKCCIM